MIDGQEGLKMCRFVVNVIFKIENRRRKLAV